MSDSSLTRNYLTAAFTLSQGNFQGGGNSYTASGLRMTARIATAGGDDSGTMMLTIYGMTLSHMNQLTVLPSTLTAVGANTVVLMAGTDPDPTTVVFQGTIQFAAVDASDQPNVCFRVQATAGLIEAVKPVPVVSQAGSVDVATLMGQIAKSMGRTFTNGGVSGLKIQNPYFSGSAKMQAAALARAAGIQWILDQNSLTIWPAGKPRDDDAITISSATGMAGYPVFTASGLVITTLFQKTLRFGSKITVQSELEPACGDWFVYYIEYLLDCQVPQGKWFAVLSAGKINVSDNA